MMFYGSAALFVWTGSYLIDSFVTLAEYAGGCPAATHFLLLRQKKVSKEKATLFVVPSLRYGHVAVLGKSGVTCKLATLKQARALFRFFLCSSPPLQGFRRQYGFGGSPHSCPLPGGEGGSPNPNSFCYPVLAGLEKVAGDGLKNLDVRRRRSRQVSKFSCSCRFFKEPRSGPGCGSPFFSLGFFGEAKKSKSPAGAIPGMVAKAHRCKINSSSPLNPLPQCPKEDLKDTFFQGNPAHRQQEARK